MGSPIGRISGVPKSRHALIPAALVAVRRAADVADELRELREQRQRERPFSVVK